MRKFSEEDELKLFLYALLIPIGFLVMFVGIFSMQRLIATICLFTGGALIILGMILAWEFSLRAKAVKKVIKVKNKESELK